MAIRADRFPHSLKVINDALQNSSFSLWISSISINNIEYILNKLGQRDKAEQVLKLIRSRFSIIPFRSSSFNKVLDGRIADFEDAIQMACAEEMGVDYIITRNTRDFTQSKTPALNPAEFLEK